MNIETKCKASRQNVRHQDKKKSESIQECSIKYRHQQNPTYRRMKTKEP